MVPTRCMQIVMIQHIAQAADNQRMLGAYVLTHRNVSKELSDAFMSAIMYLPGNVLGSVQSTRPMFQRSRSLALP